MKKLTLKDKIEYLYNCFVKVDGLWFIKAEEEFGFEKALDLDGKVWTVLAKIQARFLKNRLLADNNYHKYNYYKKTYYKYNDLKLLKAALDIKMQLDGYEFESKLIKKDLKQKYSIVEINISKCPWFEILKKSNRSHLSEKLSDKICTTEYFTFANELLNYSNSAPLDKNIKVVEFVKNNGICKSFNTCNFYFNINFNIIY